MRSASGFPEPKTTWVRPAARAHFVHPAVSSAYSLSAAARSTASVIGRPVYDPARMRFWASDDRSDDRRSVAAAAGAAAATSAAARTRSPRARVAGLRGGAVHRERRELLQHLGR